jgi:hypothetical protein
MSRYTQHYKPTRHDPVWPWLAALVVLVLLMGLVNSDDLDDHQTTSECAK